MNLRSVQRGSITITSSSAQRLAAITRVDLDHVRISKLGQEGVGGVQDNDVMVRLNMSTAIQIAANRGFADTSTVQSQFEVIEEWPL